MEEALRESEEKYRNIVETANEGIWIFDSDIKVTYANNKIAEMLGYVPEEMIGKHGTDFVDEEYKIYTEIRKEKRLQGLDEVHENKLVHRDGSTIWALVGSKSIFDKAGKFTAILSMVTDITERKQLEEQLRWRAEELATVMETTPVAIWVGHDPQSRIITGNRMANDFYEAEEGENVSANVTPIRRFFHKGSELTADELPMQEAALNEKTCETWNWMCCCRAENGVLCWGQLVHCTMPMGMCEVALEHLSTSRSAGGMKKKLMRVKFGLEICLR